MIAIWMQQTFTPFAARFLRLVFIITITTCKSQVIGLMSLECTGKNEIQGLIG